MPRTRTLILGSVALIASTAGSGWEWQTAAAQSIVSPRLAALSRDAAAARPGAIEEFWRDVRGNAPLVEAVAGDPSTFWVTYLWRAAGDPGRLLLIGGLPVERSKPLAHLAGTDVWYWTERSPGDARCGYGFVVGAPRPGTPSRIRPDPLGARTYDEQSVVELPGARPQPWSERAEKVAHGGIEAFKLKSDALEAERAVTVYTPAGYDAGGMDNGLLVVFDGEAMGGDIVGFDPVPVPVILDNLIAAKRIAPMVAVFVDGGSTRDRDLACYPPFAEFVSRELIPWLGSRYRVAADPTRAIVSGTSRGGLAAAYCASGHPEVFGNVLALSGAFWWYPEAEQDARLPIGEREVRKLGRETGWLTRQFAAWPRLAIRFYMEAGRYEVSSGGGILAESRRLRDVLEAKGNTVIYREFTGGHEYINWRGSFADGLLALAGR